MLTLYKPQRRLMDQFLTSAFDNFFPEPGTSDFTPLADIREESDKFLIKMDIPGLAKEDVKIQVEEGYLTVSGERKFESAGEKKEWIRCERTYGSFRRSFNLRGNVDEDNIAAEFNNGELTLTLPKAAKAQRKLIAIN